MSIGLCLSIIGTITGIVGMVISVFGFFHNRFLAIHQYMEALESPDFIEARRFIYNTDPAQIPLDSKEASLVVNFFHHWGLLAKKHYLPLWVFDSGSGAGVIRYYELTQEYIQRRRKHHGDNTYAKNFEWLYHELKLRNSSRR